MKRKAGLLDSWEKPGHRTESIADAVRDRSEKTWQADRFYQCQKALPTKYGVCGVTNRGIAAFQRAVVRSDFGQGRMMTARDAVKAGLADRIGDLASVLNRSNRGRKRNSLAMRKAI